MKGKIAARFRETGEPVIDSNDRLRTFATEGEARQFLISKGENPLDYDLGEDVGTSVPPAFTQEFEKENPTYNAVAPYSAERIMKNPGEPTGFEGFKQFAHDLMPWNDPLKVATDLQAGTRDVVTLPGRAVASGFDKLPFGNTYPERSFQDLLGTRQGEYMDSKNVGSNIMRDPVFGMMNIATLGSVGLGPLSIQALAKGGKYAGPAMVAGIQGAKGAAMGVGSSLALGEEGTPGGNPAMQGILNGIGFGLPGALTGVLRNKAVASLAPEMEQAAASAGKFEKGPFSYQGPEATAWNNSTENLPLISNKALKTLVNAGNETSPTLINKLWNTVQDIGRKRYISDYTPTPTLLKEFGPEVAHQAKEVIKAESKKQASQLMEDLGVVSPRALRGDAKSGKLADLAKKPSKVTLDDVKETVRDILVLPTHKPSPSMRTSLQEILDVTTQPQYRHLLSRPMDYQALRRLAAKVENESVGEGGNKLLTTLAEHLDDPKVLWPYGMKASHPALASEGLLHGAEAANPLTWLAPVKNLLSSLARPTMGFAPGVTPGVAGGFIGGSKD